MFRTTALLPLLLLACYIGFLRAEQTWEDGESFTVQTSDDVTVRTDEAKIAARLTHPGKYFFSTQRGIGPKPTQAALGYVACKRGTYMSLEDDDRQCRSCPEGRFSASGLVTETSNVNSACMHPTRVH